MAFGLTKTVGKVRSAIPLGRLLENVGILQKTEIDGPVMDTAFEADDLGVDTAPAPVEGQPNSRRRRRLRDSIVPNESFQKKLRAWWHGDIIASPRAPVKAAAIDESYIEAPEEWSKRRLDVVQALWGETFIEPGGASSTRKLFSPAMPNSKNSVLDIAAGLGGTALTLAQTQNLWMAAIESHPNLAAGARKNAQLCGLSNQVPVMRADDPTALIDSQKYDLIYARDRLFAVEDKLELLSSAAAGLKSGGHLFITDYVLKNAEAADSAAVDGWRRHEPETPHAWTLAGYVKELEELGLTVWARHDLTSSYLGDTYAGWKRVIDELEDDTFDRANGDALITEGEIWAGRTRAFEAGDLRYCRIIAQRK
jgi:SAM-dependent methyltransferase